jgi:hypothetical protein
MLRYEETSGSVTKRRVLLGLPRNSGPDSLLVREYHCASCGSVGVRCTAFMVNREVALGTQRTE